MAYVDCPKCYARVRVPDSSAEATVRCPKCSHVFAPTVPSPAAAGAAGGGSARDELRTDPFNYGHMDRPARILSAADEAMLREFGSGSGLLEMTSEAMQSGPIELPHRNSADELAGVRDLSDRQFQIVGTALTMANKLTEVYKAELARARRMSMVVWSASALILIAAVVAFGWGMGQASTASLERSNVTNSTEKAANFKTLYDKEEARGTALAAELQTVRAEARKAQGDLAAARELASQSQTTIQSLNAELQNAKTKVTQLQGQLDVARAAATMPAGSHGEAIVRP